MLFLILYLASVEWTNPDGSKGSFTPKHDSGHDDVHGPGSILPWHRYAITMFEDALVYECGWNQGIPCNLPSNISSLFF
jgi:hypothetical protein